MQKLKIKFREKTKNSDKGTELETERKKIPKGRVHEVQMKKNPKLIRGKKNVCVCVCVCDISGASLLDQW